MGLSVQLTKRITLIPSQKRPKKKPTCQGRRVWSIQIFSSLAAEFSFEKLNVLSKSSSDTCSPKNSKSVATRNGPNLDPRAKQMCNFVSNLGLRPSYGAKIGTR
ncbi:Hypothetical protein NTJ_15517 [Nesidiocoris tenuis]|uniref:Uncharacterized protein n=1 Tax=Nesidiocoris tenuis TaxID=355587 RepID=A0ABN7BEJ4_9HEMI|nr:Hypothetical protein NTJ_15517 [Nesidiocoris tenuis]